MRYQTPSGLVVTDRRHSRSDMGWTPEGYDDPRSWPPNENENPPPPDQPGVGPNMSEGFGNTHVMYPDWWPQVQAWSGWPTEWNTPNWGGSLGLPEVMRRVSTVFGCIDMNSSILSTMPPYRMAGRQLIDPLPWMSNPQPEVYTGWTEAFKQVVIAYYSGEAFLWATNRYADGTVRNWVMLNPEWVDVQMLGQTRVYYFGQRDQGGVDISEDVLHLRYMSWPGYPRGMGPLSALANNLFGVEAMERYQSNLATRGGIPWGVITAPGNLGKTQATTLRQNFVEARMSAMGAPAVLSGGVTLTPFNITPRDMALLELRQFDEARISVLLGVPPLLMGLPSGDTSMTYKNAEGIYDFHWRAHLKPKAATIMEAISNWTLPSTQSVELNRDEYVKPTATERATVYTALWNIFDPATGQRAITIDEIREAERLAVLDNTAPAPPPLPATSLAVTQGQGTPAGASAGGATTP
jgi:HK97 family phage portal protein